MRGGHSIRRVSVLCTALQRRQAALCQVNLPGTIKQVGERLSTWAAYKVMLKRECGRGLGQLTSQ